MSAMEGFRAIRIDGVEQGEMKQEEGQVILGEGHRCIIKKWRGKTSSSFLSIPVIKVRVERL